MAKRKHVFLLLVVTLFLLGAESFRPQPEDKKLSGSAEKLSPSEIARMKQIVELRDKGQLGGATDRLQDWLNEIAKDKKNDSLKGPLLRRFLAECLQEQGRYVEALPVWRAVIGDWGMKGGSPQEVKELVKQFQVEEALCAQFAKLPEPNRAQVLAAVEQLNGLRVTLDPVKSKQNQAAIEKSLAAIKATLGKGNSLYVSGLAKLVSHYRFLGRFEDCQTPLSELCGIKKELYGPTHPSYGKSLVELALGWQLLSLAERPEIDLAIDYLFGELARLLAAHKPSNDVLSKLDLLSSPAFRLPPPPNRVGTHLLLAECYQLRADYANAQRHFEFAYAGAKRKLGEKHWQVRWIGAAMEQVKKISTLDLPDRDRIRGSVEKLRQAFDFFNNHNYRDAAIQARQALELYQNAIGRVDLFCLIGKKGVLVPCLTLDNNFPGAVQELDLALQEVAREFGTDHPYYAEVLTDYRARQTEGGVWSDDGAVRRDLEKAKQIMEKVASDTFAFHVPQEGPMVEALRANGGQIGAIRVIWMTDPNAELANTLLGRAHYYMLLEDTKKAEAAHLAALRVLEGAGNPVAQEMRKVYHAATAKNQDISKESSTALLKVYETETTVRRRLWPLFLDGLALNFSTNARYEMAQRLYSLGAQIREADPTGNKLFLAMNYHNVALNYAYQNKWADGKKALQTGLSLLRQGDLFYSELLRSLALYEFSLGEYKEASQHSEDSLGFEREKLSRTMLVQTEEQQLASVSEASVGMNFYLSFTPFAEVPAARQYEWILARKGVVLENQRYLRLLLRKDPVRAREWRTAVTELAAWHRSLEAGQTIPGQQAPSVDADRISEVSDRVRKLEQSLADQFGDGPLGPKPSVTVKDVIASLPERTAVVDYMIYQRYLPPNEKGHGEVPDCLSAFLCLPGGDIKRIDLGPVVGDVRSLVGAWRRRIGADLSHKEAPAAAGESESSIRSKLRTLVWEKVQAELAGIDAVIICPAGPLAAFPFAALPGNQQQNYLLEELRISTIPAVRLLPVVARLPETSSKEGLLVVGGVNFGEPAAGQVDIFPPLPSSLKEAEEIAAIWRKARTTDPTVLVESAANKKEVLLTVSGVRYVHLATHAFYQPPARLGEGNGALRGLASLHPRLQTGIAFANANHVPKGGAEAEGILSELEIVGLDASEVELITLSACQTGIGREILGEGILGLARAFHLAGCRTVVASLWPVGDRQSKQLMSQFYQNHFLRRMDKANALREAQLDMLKKPVNRHPQLWAGWILSGDGVSLAAPPNDAEENYALSLCVAALFVILLAALVWLLLRKRRLARGRSATV